MLVGGRYDLVISDIELPGISGLELGKRIKENNPDVYLVFLTSHSEFASESYIIEAYQYILKKDIEERLSPLIERVVHEIKKDTIKILYVFKRLKAQSMQSILRKMGSIWNDCL